MIVYAGPVQLQLVDVLCLSENPRRDVPEILVSFNDVGILVIKVIHNCALFFKTQILSH